MEGNGAMQGLWDVFCALLRLASSFPSPLLHRTSVAAWSTGAMGGLLSHLRSLFFARKLEMVLVGLANSGKTTFSNFLHMGTFVEEGQQTARARPRDAQGSKRPMASELEAASTGGHAGIAMPLLCRL
jgi:hypothetical protein